MFFIHFRPFINVHYYHIIHFERFKKFLIYLAQYRKFNLRKMCLCVSHIETYWSTNSQVIANKENHVLIIQDNKWDTQTSNQKNRILTWMGLSDMIKGFGLRLVLLNWSCNVRHWHIQDFRVNTLCAFKNLRNRVP